MKFIPVEWMERVTRGGICRAVEVEREERRWFDRRSEARSTPDRRASALEEAVHEHLLDFCSPSVRAGLEHKLGARESARFAKAA